MKIIISVSLARLTKAFKMSVSESTFWLVSKFNISAYGIVMNNGTDCQNGYNHL